MPNWLIEDLYLVAVLLGVGAALSLAVWWRERQKKYLLTAGVLTVLAFAAGLVWFVVDTDQRQIKRKVEEMAAGIPTDLNRVFSHISPAFRYGSHDKTGLRKAAEDAIRKGNVTEVRVWDVRIEEPDRAARQAKVHFNFKIRGNWSAGAEFYYCRALFRLDDDGQWRLQEFKVFNPANINDPIAVPGL